MNRIGPISPEAGLPPLARRGHGQVADQAPHGRGLPPLARRGRRAGSAPARRGRVTSARAERTGRPAARAAPRAGYLRSRGEDRENPLPPLLFVGLPPLARRGHQRQDLRPGEGRVTSARAERTCPRPGCAASPTGYLRSRGEDGVSSKLVRGIRGLPPLARRGRLPVLLLGPLVRVTSARAERTGAARRKTA